LKQEQEALEYEFKLEKALQEAERQRIDAEGKAKANIILSASITDKILREKGIEATLKLAESPNTKVIVIGNSGDGLPLILGDIK
jgi:regulator of protease activity HflC (stomatin/prohibitin superfamily)